MTKHNSSTKVCTSQKCAQQHECLLVTLEILKVLIIKFNFKELLKGLLITLQNLVIHKEDIKLRCGM